MLATTQRTIAILGGSGFVGRVLANQLVAAGYPVRILTRRMTHTRELWPLPSVRCIELDVDDEADLADAVAGSAALVNLVGILNERRDDGRGFHRAHVVLTAHALAACARGGVSRYLHMSALNAAPEALSHYLQTKGQAEKLVKTAAAGINTTIFRPSVIFGPGDGLFGRFAALAGILPFLPLAGANVRFQPVYVGDVAGAFVRILAAQTVPAIASYDLGGPEQWSLHQIAAYAASISGHWCPILPLSRALARVQAELCEHLPGKPFSRDNWRSLGQDSVLTGANGLALLGIVPTPIAAVIPALYARSSARGRYSEHRRHAGR